LQKLGSAEAIQFKKSLGLTYNTNWLTVWARKRRNKQLSLY